MTAALHREWAGGPSNDRAHLQLLLARLWAAERALAGEIAEGLEVSENAALILARMRIEEVIGGSGGGASDDDHVHGYPNESYCQRCWALLTPDTPRVTDSEGDFFDTCIYCGRPAHPEDEQEKAA
jgi:hypothetical protein